MRRKGSFAAEAGNGAVARTVYGCLLIPEGVLSLLRGDRI